MRIANASWFNTHHPAVLPTNRKEDHGAAGNRFTTCASVYIKRSRKRVIRVDR
jgi:hypothetical protein